MAGKIEGSSPYPFPRAPEGPQAVALRLTKVIDEQTVQQLLKVLGNTANTPASAPPQIPAQRPGELLPMLVAYDRNARTLNVPRESWTLAVLEPAFKQSASNPEALHRLIAQAVAEGFVEESLPPAQQLARIDPSPLRAASMLGTVLLQMKRFDEALSVLEAAAQTQGEDATVLMKIARAYAGLGKADKSEDILWRALTLDPNQEEAVEWFAAIGRERDGKSGQTTAWQRIASLPASWLAQLSLAKVSLEDHDLDGAMRFYKEALQRRPDMPEPALIRISSDLAQHGAIRQLLTLLEPDFDAAKHGLLVGGALIAAHLEMDQPHAARQILDILYALQRPDWREHLVYWKKRVDDADYGPMKLPKSLRFELLRLGNPIWTYGNPDFEALLPSTEPDVCRVVLVCGSGDFGPALSDPGEVQPSDALGRLARFIPMFFAEELRLRTEAQSIVLMPWLASGGFFLSARPWQREELKIEDLNASFVLTMHVDAQRKPWTLQFSLMTGNDGFVLDRWEQAIRLRNPAPAVLSSLRRVLQTLCLLDRHDVSEDLAAPEGAQLSEYLAAIERALAVIFANTENIDNTPRAEQFIFDDLLQLAIDTPGNARTRCLLVNSLYRAALSRPDIVHGYWQKLQQLQIEHPLQEAPTATALAAAIDRLGARLNPG